LQEQEHDLSQQNDSSGSEFGLLSFDAQGTDSEEEAFIRQMQRKKKKKQQRKI